MIELDIGDKAAAALILGWAGVLAEPGSSERLFFKDLVPIVDEYSDQPPLDIGLLASISNSPTGHCHTTAKHRGGSSPVPFAGIQLESHQRPTHLLNHELNLLLIMLCPFLAFGPLNSKGAVDIRVFGSG